MTKKEPIESRVGETKDRRLVAMHLQYIEDNPLTSEEIVMFEMFERESWSHDRRLAYIKERARIASLYPAAE